MANDYIIVLIKLLRRWHSNLFTENTERWSWLNLLDHLSGWGNVVRIHTGFEGCCPWMGYHSKKAQFPHKLLDIGILVGRCTRVYSRVPYHICSGELPCIAVSYLPWDM